MIEETQSSRRSEQPTISTSVLPPSNVTRRGGRLHRLDELVDATDVTRSGMIATSFEIALSKFHRSHSSDSPYEHLVDLATALKAILAGGEGDNEALTFRNPADD